MQEMAAFSPFLRFLKWKMDGKWKMENRVDPLPWRWFVRPRAEEMLAAARNIQ
jgi:hypothetical protein